MPAAKKNLPKINCLKFAENKFDIKTLIIKKYMSHETVEPPIRCAVLYFYYMNEFEYFHISCVITF